MTHFRLPLSGRGRRPRPASALALLFAAAAFGCGGSDESAGGRPGGGPPGGFPGGGFPGGPGGAGSAVPVEVVEISRGEISAFIETNGTLEAEREVDVVARTGGPLVEILTEEGRTVRAGDLLARIDETELRAQVEISRVALSQAEVAYERARASLENQVVSQEVYDTAQSTLESARAQLNGNEIQLGYARIAAPFDGLIIERAVKHGETITNGQRVFRLSDFDPLLCRISVPERDLTRIAVGQPAHIEVEAFPGEIFEGRVLRISPVVDAATGTIRVTLEVNRRDRLSPGMFATVRLVTDVRAEALILPKRALSLESLADEVFVVQDGVARRRALSLGYEEDDRVEVTGGLEAGDRVIVVGQDGLTDETPVQILAGPGADEPPPTRRASAPAAPDPERLEAVRERMRARGMSEEDIEARIASFAAGRGRAGGGPPPAPAAPAASEGPPADPPSPGGGAATAGPADGGATEADPADSEAPEPEPESPGEERPGGFPMRDGAAEGGAPRFEELPVEAREAIRERLRNMGLTEEQIEERTARGWRTGPPPGAAEGELTPEAEAALRARLKERGLSDEEIEQIVARRRGGEPSS